MPERKIPLVTGEFYHVFNHGVDRIPTFGTVRECKRAELTSNFYRFSSPPIKLSKMLILSSKKRKKVMEQASSRLLVKILSYVLMPDHLHFLVQQATDNGISKFMSNFQNSYTRYFNVRHNRIGALFLGQFRAVRIETRQQLYQVSRYIHLDPYFSQVAKNRQELKKYPWSSLPEYLDPKKDGFCNKNIILSDFSNPGQYQKFVFDRAGYQHSLEKIAHLIQEKTYQVAKTGY